MIARTLTAALLSLVLFACGVKTDLEMPSQKKPEPTEVDPSLPPQPLGQ